MVYIKQIDSLRAIAVILVIISHWLPQEMFINYLPNGAIGVVTFFVISGFLISGILFQNRKKAEEFGIAKLKLAKNFYAKRALRIFPIYYITIILLLIFSKYTNIEIASKFVYYATYTSNFYLYFRQTWDGALSHLWSLSVEEQFYLIWPWILLYVNRKYLLHVILLFIGIGVISQYFFSGPVVSSSVLTFTSFDAFGLGALLAWQFSYNEKHISRFYRYLSIAAAIALVLFGIGVVRKQFPIISLQTLIAVIALWIIAYITLNQENLRCKFILNNRVLIFLGKISYGLYLYHNFIGMLVVKSFNKFINPLLPDILYKQYWAPLYWLEAICMLLAMSWLSYILIEKRFLELKKRFQN